MKMGANFRTGFDNRWIDVYENVGKCSGAYSAGLRKHPYVAALNYSGKLDKAAQVQGSIDKRIGIDSEWYACQERNGNLEAIANANQATQQALKNSIIAYHDNVLKAEDNVRIAEEALDAAQNDIERQAASIKLENAQREVRTTYAPARAARSANSPRPPARSPARR